MCHSRGWMTIYGNWFSFPTTWILNLSHHQVWQQALLSHLTSPLVPLETSCVCPIVSQFYLKWV